MRPWRGLLWCAVLVLGLGVPAPPAAHAQSEPSISVSDTTPTPGQQLTVSGSGFLASSPIVLYLLPESRYPSASTGSDGAFRTTITISRDSIDGAKQLVVRGLKPDGTHAYLTADLRVAGAPASATLSDTELTPSERVQLTGNRFKRGTQVVVVLFPEHQLLGRLTASSDQRIDAELTMPELLFNGPHVIVVAGSEARAGYAWLELSANVSGGMGPARPITGSGRELLEGFLASSTTSSSSTSTTAPREAAGADDDGGSGARGLWIFLVLLLLLAVAALAALVASWLRTPEGRRWAARRGWRRPA